MCRGDVLPWGQFGFCLNYSLFQKSDSLTYLCRCTEVNHGFPCRSSAALTKVLRPRLPSGSRQSDAGARFRLLSSPAFARLARVTGNVKR